MSIIRTVIDIEVPGHVSKGEVARYAESLKDYAAVVLGPAMTEKTTEELNPEVQHHVHDGTGGGCRACRYLYNDDKADSN